MADFSSGVSGFVTATATVTVKFPIDNRGNADVCCFQCPYYSQSSRICQLNKAVPAYPSKYIGQDCPFWESLREGGGNNG